LNLEQFSTRISSNFPSFEIRFWWLIILLIVIITSFVVIFVFKKKSKIVLSWYILILVLSVFLILSPLFLDSGVFEFFDVNNTYPFHIPLWLIAISGFIFSILQLFHKSNRGKVYDVKEIPKSSKEKSVDKVSIKSGVLTAFKILHIAVLILSFLFLVSFLLVSLFAKPYVTLPESLGDNISTVERIQFSTTVPVRKNELEVNVSPEQVYTVEYDNFLFFNNLITGLTIVPKYSYPANTKIVTYFTGLSNLWPGGRYHEQNLDFFTPPLPVINATNFPEDGEYVPVDTEIDIQLSGVTGEFVYWDIKIEPEAEHELIEKNNSLVIRLGDLKQGTEYKVVLSQAERIFDITTGQDKSIGELKGVATFNFQTTPPPNIESYNWKSEQMSVKEPLRITFSDKLKEENLEDYFVIEPETLGELKLLDDGQVLQFTPDSGFKKNTDYKVTVKSGLENKLGGYLEEDAILEFSTPGYLYVIGVYPRNYSTGIKRGFSTISVTFNQPVNKSSAQSSFSISPSINGSFYWRDNTMYYNLSSSLSYGTRYSIKIASGVDSLYGYALANQFQSVFTTEEETFKLDVPQYYQVGGEFSCNLVATKMALAYKGVSTSIDSIKSSIGVGQDPNSSFVEGYGVHWGPISSYISSRGVSNTIKSGWNVNSLVQEVKSGHPVILFWYNGYTTPKEAFELEGGYTGYHGMHSEVVVGFVGKVDSPSKIILNDPWRGPRQLSIGTFNSMWSYLGNKAIVVY
jgi:uncharacterized protein YvpB